MRIWCEGGRETRFHEDNKDSEEHDEDEAEDSSSPNEANPRNEGFEEQRDDNTAKCATCGCDTRRLTALYLEIVTYSGEAGREDESCTNAADYSKDKYEMPVFCRN